jgi:hypothetical protein
MPVALKDLSPLRVIIGNEDVTSYLQDSGFSFSNVDPGGYESLSAEFPRDMATTLRGQYVRVDSGLHVAWEGRISQVQRSLGNSTTLTGEGFGALFKDNAGSMVFVDRDLTQWGDPSYTRQAQLVGLNIQLGNSEVAADPTSGNPALVQSITDSWAAPNLPDCEAWYNSGPGNLIAYIYYSLSDSTFTADNNWHDAVNLSSDANGTTQESTGTLSPPVSSYFAPATGYRFAYLGHNYPNTNHGVQGATYNAYWHNLAVYGHHGLTRRGSDPGGFYPSDIFGWVVGQTPGLQQGNIQTTDGSNYIVPHYVQYTPVTLDSIVGDMSTIQGWHWGVWESTSPLTGNATPRADFLPRPAPGAFTAFCRRSDCDTLDLREDLSQQYNVCVVAYTNVDGSNGAVTVTADNPILDEAGVGTRVLVVSGGTMTPADAAIYGLETLTIANIQQRVTGSMDIISPIDTGVGYAPAWLLKAGLDRIRVADVPSYDAWGSMSDYPISRVEASMSSGGMNTSVEIGSGADLVETLNSRLQASTALAAQGA